jgi:hypothetical protein
VSYAPGSPLSEAVHDHAEAAVTTTSLQVIVTFLALERVPETTLDPLSAHSRTFVDMPARRGLVSEPSLLAGARAGNVADVPAFLAELEGRAARLPDLRGALPRNVTASFAVERDRPNPAREERLRERVRVLVHRLREGDLELAVEITGASASHEAQGELAVLDPVKLSRKDGFAVIVPSPFQGEQARAIAAVVLVAPPPADDAPAASAHRAACLQCDADLARAAVLLGKPPARPLATAPPPPDLSDALLGLSRPGERRTALFSIAQAGGAPVAEDLALTADEKVLRPICERIAKKLAALEAPTRGPALGWLVEREALDGVQDLAHDADLPPQIELVLARRSGAVSRSLGTFFGIVDASQSLDELEGRLRAGNLDLLEDGSPAIRARAFDWLAARKLAPAGYDPLGPANERRDALQRAETKRGPS